MKRDNTTTQRYFADAGISRGMHVIEIGCGGGEVTQILAVQVDSSGSVVAIDRDQRALATAEDRMRGLGIEHVKFVCADVTKSDLSLEAFPHESFDVLAGRRVLMYLQNPVEVLRCLSRLLKSGGLIVFEETDSTMVPARTSSMPAHDQATELFRRMLVAEGANTAMGFELPTALVQAGLQFEKIRAEAVIQGQGSQDPLPALLGLVQSRLITAGIASQSEIDSLAVQLRMESRDPACVYVSEMSFCAWARKP